MKTEVRILLFLVVLLLVTTLLSCTAGPNVLEDSAGANNAVAGFWRGLWHGFICLFTLIASLFSKSVTVYEVHNNGGWYNFGFILGVAMFFGCKAGGRRAKPLHSDCSSWRFNVNNGSETAPTSPLSLTCPLLAAGPKISSNDPTSNPWCKGTRL